MVSTAHTTPGFQNLLLNNLNNQAVDHPQGRKLFKPQLYIKTPPHIIDGNIRLTIDIDGLEIDIDELLDNTVLSQASELNYQKLLELQEQVVSLKEATDES